MKLKIYLNTDGQELHAQGKQVWSWHFSVRTESQYEQAPEGGVLLAECVLPMPSPEACIPAVLEALKQREQAVNAQAHEDLAAIKLRRDNLLALTYTDPTL